MKATRKAIAYHEAGHVLAYLLMNRKFKYVTIKWSVSDDKRVASGGHVKHRSLKSDKWESMSIINPDQFMNFFAEDFFSGAGFISECNSARNVKNR